MRFTSWYENRRRPFNFETLSEPNKIIRSSSVNPLHLAVGIPPPCHCPLPPCGSTAACWSTGYTSQPASEDRRSATRMLRASRLHFQLTQCTTRNINSFFPPHIGDYSPNFQYNILFSLRYYHNGPNNNICQLSPTNLTTLSTK